MTESVQSHEKIRTQMLEHTTLRAEIIARTGHGYQLLGFGLAGIAIIASKDISEWGVVYIVVVIMLVITAGLFSWMDIKKCALRIREIEIDVNDRAQEDLIIWENLNGEAKLGFLRKNQDLPREHLRTLDYPIRTFRGEPITPISN